MGKIVRFFLIFIIVTLAFSSSYIEEFDTKFDNASKSEKIRIYHGLRNTYIQSILNDNSSAKIETLIRLIKSSKELGLDYSHYEKELKAYGKTDLLKKIEDNISNKPATNQKTDPKTKEDLKQKKITLKILGVKINNDSLTLNLNRTLYDSEIKDFTLRTKKFYKNVYDINGIATLKTGKINTNISSDVRIAQYNKSIVRLVFSNNTKQEISFEQNKNSITFYIDNKQKEKTKNSSNAKDLNKPKQAIATVPNKSKQISNVPKLSSNFRTGKTVVLDPGHGGKDSGAIGSRTLYEKNVVLKIALKAGKILRQRGYKVYFTRDKDYFIGLRNRTSFANDKMADLFISIHANAAPTKAKANEIHGIETFFLSPTRSARSMRAANLENKADTDEMNYFTKISFLNFLNREKIIASNKLAIDIQKNLLNSVRKKYSVTDGGVREAPFWVLVGALMPAVLIETGYITHPIEGKLLAKDDYEEQLAIGIANGVDDYFAKNR